MRSKLQLLEEEIAFNRDLAATLEQIRSVRHGLEQANEALDQADLSKAVELFLQSDSELGSIQTGQNIHAIAVLQLEGSELSQKIANSLTQRWHDAIRIDVQMFIVSLPYDVECKPLLYQTVWLSSADYRIFVALSSLTNAMQKMGLLEELISDFAIGLESAIIKPRLQLQANMHDRLLAVEGGTMNVSGTTSPSDLYQLLSDMGTLLSFLQTHLPPSIVNPLSKVCGPHLVESLISMRLSSAVPQNLSALQKFSNTREEVYRFFETMSSNGWPGADQLRTWTSSIPQVWLEKRQRQSLDQVRQLVKRGLGDLKAVERVETQRVSQQDQLFQSKAGNEDWDAGWSEEEDESSVQNEGTHRNNAIDDEEGDVSAWGLDDQGDDEGKSKGAAASANDDEEADSWGWEVDNDNEADPSSPQRRPETSTARAVNGHSKSRSESEREITLRETYNITSLPVEILQLIDSILSDADAMSKQRWVIWRPQLSQSKYLPGDKSSSSDDSSMAPAVPGLFHLPNLLLVMYRASASSFYMADTRGNMLLYNDCQWLVDQLRQTAQKRGRNHEKLNVRFEDDIAALESFGKRSYGKEMESQRTIIKDILDGAQGFANCTEPPFSQGCDLAVNSIVDRLRDIHKQWKTVLSHSALLQSVGSLLSTVIDKVIVDIEDMSDIPEPESQRLTAYCKQIIALEDLFLPHSQAESASSEEQQETVPLTAVYAPGWFKFQYLSEILDSSLVDIKYLWTDGGLKLEYEVEEVVELIEALFTDSEHRRRAIGDIRRASGR